MKKNKTSYIVSMVSYILLIGAWFTTLFIMASVAYEAPFADDILIWYENRFGNLSFTLSSVVVIIFLTASIVYILVTQENKLYRRKR